MTLEQVTHCPCRGKGGLNAECRIHCGVPTVDDEVPMEAVMRCFA